MRHAYRSIVKIAVIGSILLFCAAAIGQYRVGRFPTYFDLVVAPLIPIGILIVVGAVFFLAGKYYKVYVSRQYLYCYTTYGKYRLVYWRDIQDIGHVDYYGMHYLLLSLKDSSSLITVPTWLNDMSTFRELVKEYAGANHILSEHLDEIAT